MLFENSSAEGRTTLEVLGQSAVSNRRPLSKTVSDEVLLMNVSIERAAINKSRAGGSVSDVTNPVKSAAGGKLSSNPASINLLGAIGFGAGVAALITIVLSGPGGLVFLFGGAAIFAGVLSKFHKAIDPEKSNANNDKGQAGGKLSSDQTSMYFLVGFGVALVVPIVAMVPPIATLALTAGLVALALAVVDTLTDAGKLDKATKFYAYSMGTSVAALITSVIFGFGAPFVLTVGAAVLTGVLGKIHKAMHLKNSNANNDKGQAGGKISDDSFNPKNWLYLKIGAALVGFLAALALVPEAFIPQALSQIGGALFMSWIFGKSDLKLDAIAFTVAIAAMIAVPLLAPAAMLVTALGAVGTAYFLFLLFA